MMHRTLCLSVFISVIGLSCSSDPVQVISGLFMPNNISVDYDGAKTACAMQYSRLATLEDITFAYRMGYEICKWGWIEEKRVVMPRLMPFEGCSGYNVGLLIRDCPNIRETFCVDSASGTVFVLPIPTSLVPSYENASIICTNSRYTVATKEQIEKSASNIPANRLAWYDWGVGQLNNGIFEENSCNDVLSHASAFCYNPALSDVIISNDNRTWKKIAIGCIIAFIFVVLLAAAAFMRGNKFVCCMGDKRTHSPQTTQVPVPTWNKTSIYRRMSHMNKDTIYDNMVNVEKRPPVIRPEMSNYRTHYSNMGFDTIGEE